MTRPKRSRPQSLPTNYRDTRVNFPSPLADNITSITVGGRVPVKTEKAVYRIIDIQNRFRNRGAR